MTSAGGSLTFKATEEPIGLLGGENLYQFAPNIQN